MTRVHALRTDTQWVGDGEQEGSPTHEGREVDEVARLQDENRRLAVSLGGFSAFLASRGLLEDAWQYVHALHELDEGAAR